MPLLSLSVTRSSHAVLVIAIAMYQKFRTGGMYQASVLEGVALNVAPQDLPRGVVRVGPRMVEPGTYQWHEPAT